VGASEEDNRFCGRLKPGEPHSWLRGATNPQAGAQRAVGVVRNDMDGPNLSVGMLESTVELRFNREVGAPVTSVEGHL